MLFLKALFHNPRAIGAVVPSSSYLANSMAQEIDLNTPGYILELGPGTGVVTRAILAAGIPPEKLLTLEISSDFANNLRKEFPDITVTEGNATELSHLFENKRIHTVISSLPLLSLSQYDREKILSEIQKILSPQGKLIQFTYSQKTKDDFYPKDFVLEKSHTIWRNIPPARVMVFLVSN